MKTRPSIPLRPQMPTNPGGGMLDELAEAWREACNESAIAYRDWCGAPAAQRRTAYTVYLAAADREAAAESALVNTVRGR